MGWRDDPIVNAPPQPAWMSAPVVQPAPAGFDLSTAKPVSADFDLSTAKPVAAPGGSRPDLTQIYAALQKADAAGDTAGAKQLADYIRKVQSSGSGPWEDYAAAGPWNDYKTSLPPGFKLDAAPLPPGFNYDPHGRPDGLA